MDLDPVEMPPTQIARAVQELQIAWIPAHSPQAKGAWNAASPRRKTGW